MFKQYVALGALAAGLAFSGSALAQQGEPPRRTITQISGDLYMFTNNFHNSVFLVTSEGVIATDPIDADAAAWLEEEIRNRFSQEIRYLIYSHDHFDHINGGEVFADTATVVAHQQAKEDIIFENRATAVPQVTFTDEMTIELGGKTVELIFPGRSHSDNLIVMHFPEERALFAVDFIPIRQVAYINFPDAYIGKWIDTLDVVSGMDFDVLLPGHGAPGTREDVGAFRQYLVDLRDAVTEQIKAGATLEQAQANIKLEQYAEWGLYEQWLPLNIEGMYNDIMRQRIPNPA